MKKVFALLLCLSMILSAVLLSACNSTSKTENTDPASEKPTETDAEKPTEKPTEPRNPISDEDLKIEKEDKTEVVRLIKDVRQGEMLTAEHLINTVMTPESVPEGALTDYASIIGKYAKTDLPAGSFFYDSNISLTEVEYIPDVTPPAEEDARKMGYLIITDYIDVKASNNLAPAINKVILDNPNRTIFFPDGTYYISEPIMTPANPKNSVSLYLSNYAVIKASKTWNSNEAMIRLGAAEPYNNITLNGSNYYMYGGIIDGSGVANGVSIDSGRETSVRFVSIKNTPIGLHIKHGANSGSSDADIDTVNIVGTNGKDSVGVLVEGYDNTISNMRIANVQIGVKLVGGGNFLRNLHPLMTFGGMGYDYKDCIGFWDISGSNFFDFCYSDQFAIGFRMGDNSKSVYQSCFCFWYTTKGDMQIGFKSDGNFNAFISSSRVSVKDGCPNTAYLKIDGGGGDGVIQYPLCCDALLIDKAYKNFLDGSKVIPY